MADWKNIESNTSVRKTVNRNSIVVVCDREQYKEKKKGRLSLKISISIKVQNDYCKGQKHFVSTMERSEDSLVCVYALEVLKVCK